MIEAEQLLVSFIIASDNKTVAWTEYQPRLSSFIVILHIIDLSNLVKASPNADVQVWRIY